MFGLADRENKNKAILVWVMFWYHEAYTAAIGNKLQNNEKPETLHGETKTPITCSCVNLISWTK